MKILTVKRLITLITAVILAVTGLCAQNANRNGFFIELQGGTALGKVLKYDKNGAYSNSRLKGGVITSLDFGYRFGTTTHFSFDTKMGIWANLADSRYTYQFRILPGVRWTSKDFGSSYRSAYLGLSIGLGITPASKDFRDESCDTGIFVPIELSAGMNFSLHFYGGLFINHCISAGGRKCTELKFYDYANADQEYVNVWRRSYQSLGLRLGYRF